MFKQLRANILIKDIFRNGNKSMCNFKSKFPTLLDFGTVNSNLLSYDLNWLTGSGLVNKWF